MDFNALACCEISKSGTNGVVVGWNQQFGCLVVWLSSSLTTTLRVGRRRKQFLYSLRLRRLWLASQFYEITITISSESMYF